MERVPIKKGQIWLNKRVPNHRLLITGVKGGKFLAKVLTDKPDVYAGSHRMATNTLYSKYSLV
jgi:hypothetical protein